MSLASSQHESPVADAAGPLRPRSAILDEITALVGEWFALEPEEDPERVPLSVPLYGAEEVVGALEALLTQNVTMGARVREFEAAFADYIGAEHALMVNSGSSANLLALAVLSAQALPGGLEPGDEVIVPAVTWSTTVAPILQMGLVPVFVDIDPDTLNLRTEELTEAWSPRTRAVMPVHLLGNPVDMQAVTTFAAERELLVIEDACEALGSSIGGRFAGSIGDVGTFSFFFSHHITTVEGGMLVTNDDRVAGAARSLRAHGWTRDMPNRRDLELANPSIDPRFLFVHLGFNLRPMETQAAFGLVQLTRLDGYNGARRRNAERLREGLADLGGELHLVSEQEGGRSTWFGFPVIARDAATREALSRHLEERGIQTRPIVAGNLVEQPAFRDSPHRAVGDLANATAAGQRGLFIGNHPGLDDRRIEHVIASFRSFFA